VLSLHCLRSENGQREMQAFHTVEYQNPKLPRTLPHNDLKAQFHHVLRFGDSLRSTTRSLRVRRKSRPTDRLETNWFQNKAHALVAHIQPPRYQRIRQERPHRRLLSGKVMG
jgi:hypothetical protein